MGPPVSLPLLQPHDEVSAHPDRTQAGGDHPQVALGAPQLVHGRGPAAGRRGSGSGSRCKGRSFSSSGSGSGSGSSVSSPFRTLLILGLCIYALSSGVTA